jgi:hypothetical protein
LSFFLKLVPFLLSYLRIEGTLGREDVDILISALRNGDSNPSGAVSAALAHNRNVITNKGGCHIRGPKIVNVGLPRTGTLSFVDVMKNGFGVRACHQLPFHWEEYAKEVVIWKEHPLQIGSNLKKSLRHCIAFSDIPHYALYRSFEQRYPSTRFVMTIRGRESWLNSTEVLMKLWKGRIPMSKLYFIQKFFGVQNKLGWGREEYIESWERHTREVLTHFGNRVLLLPLEFSDSEKLRFLSSFIACTSKYSTYARSHTSQRSKESNSLQSLSAKCKKSPKKCGF